MKIKTEIEFAPFLIRISAGVRYWEDAKINGVEDSDGSLIPHRQFDSWKPVIYFATGQVLNWPNIPKPISADIHYKVCDAGEYWLEDVDGKRVKYKGDYVPSFLSVGERGCGDYIVLKIKPDGFIEGWQQPELDGDDWILEK